MDIYGLIGLPSLDTLLPLGNYVRIGWHLLRCD